MEKSQTNLNVIQRFYDAYNKKQEAILSEVIADNYVDYGHEPPGRVICPIFSPCSSSSARSN